MPDKFILDSDRRAFYKSDIGTIRLTADDEGLTSLYFIDDDPGNNDADPVLDAALMQLDQYFQGKRSSFEIACNPRGTSFQNRVWKALAQIPFGKTVSYLDIALLMNDRNAVRAVGRANGQNPISIILPCHRVIGSNGKLIGYGGGIWRKEWLLKHEGALLA